MKINPLTTGLFSSGIKMMDHRNSKINISSSDAEVLEEVLKLGKDTINYLPGQIIPAILSVVGVSIFTRIFSPNEYGQYTLVVATTGIIAVVMSNWVKQSVLRFFPKFKENNRLPFFKKNAITIVLFMIIAFGILSIIFYPLRSLLGKYARFYLPAVLLVITTIVFDNLSAMFQANLQSRKYSKYRVALAFGRITLALTFVSLIAKDVAWLIIGVVASYALLIFPMIRELGLIKLCNNIGQKLDFSLFKKFILYGFPMIGWFMGSLILSISDRFLIEVFRNSREVGIYSSNYNIVNSGIGLVSSPLLIAAYPLIMSAWESGNRQKIGEIIASFSRYFLLIAIPLVVYLSIFGQEVVSILLGEKFREGYIIIPIVLMGFLAWNFGMYGHKCLEIKEKTGTMFFLVFICVALNIVLNLIFIPKYGYIAAAITTLISYMIYPIIVYFVTRLYLRWQIPWRSMTNIVVSSVLTGGILASLKYTIFNGFLDIVYLFIFTILGLLLYIGILYLFGEVREYESQYLLQKVSALLRKRKTH